MVASDLAALGVGGVLLPHSSVAAAQQGWFVVYAVLVVVSLASLGGYRKRLRVEVLDELRVVVAATAIAAMSITTLSVATSGDRSGASAGVFLWGLGAALILAGRWGVARARAIAASKPATGSRTVVVGAGELASRLARRLLAHPQFGLQPVGLVGWRGDSSAAPVPVIGSLSELEHVVDEAAVDHVVVAVEHEGDAAELLQRCRRLPVEITLAPRVFEHVPSTFVVEPVGGTPLLTIDPVDPGGLELRARDYVEQALAGVLLLVLAPVLVACALAVVCSLGRPILYRQVRVGRGGVSFEMLKFRTMQADPGSLAGRLILRGDLGPGGVEGVDRRTRLGRVLRSTSLDELPQLVNVVRGEMSLVGPRPERQVYVDAFEETVPRYGERHRVRGGITGLAQINGLRGKTSISERAECDNYYIDHWSPWLELKILLRTLAVVLRIPHGVE